MKYPVENFLKEFNTTAGYGFGAVTDYGRHEGADVNKNGGGDIELGTSWKAIAKGRNVYYHTSHPNTGFGNHNVQRIEGPWGVRWVHNAHMLGDLIATVRDVAEGEQVGRIGKSGTQYAHCHFAVFKVDPAGLRNGIDTIAKNVTELNAWWEDPIAFINKWLGGDSGMADMYKGLDLSNKESMKAAVDIWYEVMQQGLWTKKSEIDAKYVSRESYNNAVNALNDYKRDHPENPAPVTDPAAVEKLRKIKEAVANDPAVIISKILEG